MVIISLKITEALEEFHRTNCKIPIQKGFNMFIVFQTNVINLLRVYAPT